MKLRSKKTYLVVMVVALGLVFPAITMAAYLGYTTSEYRTSYRWVSVQDCTASGSCVENVGVWKASTGYSNYCYKYSKYYEAEIKALSLAKAYKKTYYVSYGNNRYSACKTL